MQGLPSSSLKDLLVARFNAPDTVPFLFKVGQKVVLRKDICKDGQTPAFWKGATVKVLSVKSTAIHKDHIYKLQHENGQVDEFREEEITKKRVV
jgi:hypothetical protein